MPYIDLEYAKRLLENSTCGAERSSSRNAHPGAGAHASFEDTCESESVVSLDEASLQGSASGGERAPRRTVSHSSDAVFELRPVCEAYTEGQQGAFEKVKRLALVRERSTGELIQRLVRDGFSREDAENAVQRAVACGLVDDIRYGAVLVRSRMSQGRGRHGIEQELQRLGIVASDIPGWPEEFFSRGDFDPFRDDADEGVMRAGFGGMGGDAAEIERALALLRRKPPRAKNVQAAAYRKLIAKGYSNSVAQAATRRYLEEK